MEIWVFWPLCCYYNLHLEREFPPLDALSSRTENEGELVCWAMDNSPGIKRLHYSDSRETTFGEPCDQGPSHTISAPMKSRKRKSQIKDKTMTWRLMLDTSPKHKELNLLT